jgi:hypothetical protein
VSRRKAINGRYNKVEIINEEIIKEEIITGEIIKEVNFNVIIKVIIN